MIQQHRLDYLIKQAQAMNLAAYPSRSRKHIIVVLPDVDGVGYGHKVAVRNKAELTDAVNKARE